MFLRDGWKIFQPFPFMNLFRESGKVERSGKANDGPINPSKAPEGFGSVWMEMFAPFSGFIRNY